MTIDIKTSPSIFWIISRTCSSLVWKLTITERIPAHPEHLNLVTGIDRSVIETAVGRAFLLSFVFYRMWFKFHVELNLFLKTVFIATSYL